MEKERRTKALLLSTLVVVVATLSIAFAAMSRTLSINGIGKMDTASWNVYFDNLSSAKITRGAQEVGKPKISDDKGIVQDINVKLSNPKDEISYTVDIVNDGTIDAEITMIKDIELTDVQKKVFEFKVTYTDTGEILKDGDILPKKTTKNITINIKFKDDITEFDLPTEAQTINLSYQITYTQYDGNEIVIEPDGSENENLPRYTLSNTWNGRISIGKNNVESVNFLRNTNVPEQALETVFDVSNDNDNSVIGWYEDSDSNGLYEVSIGSEGIVAAPEASDKLFMSMTALKKINFNNNFDTSNVIQMGVSLVTPVPLTYGMFYGCSSLEDLDLSSFDTSNVTNMSGMFRGCSSLTSLDLSNFNTSNVINMSLMFYGCSSLEDLDLSSFDILNLKGKNAMFYNCSSLKNLDLSNSYLKDLTIFSTTTNLTTLTNLILDNADLSTITDISSVFKYLTNLTTVSMNNIKLSGEVSMKEAFSGCNSLQTINFSVDKSSDVEIDMSYMFSGCSSLTSLDLSNFDTSKVVNMSWMFNSCSSLTSLDLSNWDTSNVTDMNSMFDRCNSLTSLDLSSFDTSNVTSMRSMFYFCSSLTEINMVNAEFTNDNIYLEMFANVTLNFTIYVKDETSRNVVLGLRSDANVIIGAPTA